MKGIFVKVMWSVDSDGSPVDVLNQDWDLDDAPLSIYGPFKSMSEAESWMVYYPDGDDDLHDMEANTYEFPDRYHINPPEFSFAWPPEEEPEFHSQEIQGS